MKKTTTLVSAMVITLAVSAQHRLGAFQQVAPPDAVQKNQPMTVAGNYLAPWTETQSNFGADMGAVLFSEDFANDIPATWNNTSGLGGAEVWVYRGPNTNPSNATGGQGAFTGGAPLASTSAANGFVIFDSDFQDNGGDGNNIGGGVAPTPHLGWLESPVIDLSGEPLVRIEWEHAWRNFSSSFRVETSTDGFVTRDTVFTAPEATNESSANPVQNSIDISSSIGGSPTAQFRFVFESLTNPNGDGYYEAMVDDIRLVQPPNNDLTLNQQYFDGAGSDLVNTQSVNYYTLIPEDQANADVITFGGAIANNGGAAQPNTVVNATVTGPGTFNQNSPAQTLMAGAFDTVDVSTTFVPNGGLGVYNVSFEVSSDSMDAFLGDNSSTASFEVTQFDYSRQDDNVSSGNSWGGGVGYSVFTRFDINTTQTFDRVSINFFSQAGFETTDGSIAEVGIWPVVDGNGVGTTLQDPTADIGATPLASDPFWVINAADFNNTVIISLPTPVEIDPADYPEVLVGFKYVTGQIRFSSSALVAQDAQTLVDVDNDGLIDGATALVPVVALHAQDANICDNTQIGIIGNVTCNNDFTATIDVSITGNPNGNVSFAWSNSQTSEDITVDAEGTFTVTVTDGSGCTNEQSFTVDNATLACNLSVNDPINDAFNFAVYPNPNDGRFNVEINSAVADNFQIQVRNVIGQVVHSENLVVNGRTFTALDLSGLDKGVYFINLSGGAIEKTQKVIIR